MSKRGWAIAGLVVIVAAGAAVVTRDQWWPERARAQPAREAPTRSVPVDVATAIKKASPLRLEALGAVQPMASVAIKSRLETEIVEVHFADGAAVKAGDLLFTLDGRSIEAQIQQAEGVLVRDRAQLEGAERDVRRFTELLARNAGTRVSVENAQTQTDMLRGTIKANESSLKQLRVQLSYTKIYAPITGRISAASVKAGNFVRPADVVPLATIVQTKPVYVGFGIPQRSLGEVRRALQTESGQVEALAPGEAEPAIGKLAMIDNTVDATTGMLTVRAIMDNEGESLWPGTLVNIVLTLRIEEAVTVPSIAVQTGQSGTYVFVIENGAARVRSVKVARTFDGESVISEGLEGGETVVTDGQLLLVEGTRVAPRNRKAGA